MPKAQFFEGSYPKGNNSEKTFVDEYIRDKNFQENWTILHSTNIHDPNAGHWKTNTELDLIFISQKYGFIQLENNGIIIEQKNSDKHGTTEEKVFYDLEKIRLGVYGTVHELWYVFTGDVCNEVNAYKEFQMQAEALKLPVKIIFGWEAFEKELENINGGK